MPMSSSYDDRTVSVLEEAERLKLNCQHEESIALLESLLSHDPGNVAALEELADNELSLERHERAVNAAKQAVALDHQSYMGHYVLGFAASLKGHWDAAHKELRTANVIRSNHPEILRCLGWVLFHRGERVQGMVTLERALNLDPDSVLCLCDLGVCSLHVGDYRKARTLFERARALDPQDSRVRECMEIAAKMGESERVWE